MDELVTAGGLQLCSLNAVYIVKWQERTVRVQLILWVTVDSFVIFSSVLSL